VRLGLIFFLVTTLLFRREALSVFSSHVIGGASGDISIFLYIAQLIPEHGFFFPRWFDLPIMYPYGRVLAWSDNFLVPASLAFFFRQLGAGFVESVNLVNLLVTFLNGFITFLYLRTKSSKVGSLWGGVMMQGLPFLALHLGHPQLQIVFIFPLALLLVNLKKGFLGGVLLGILLGFSFLYGVYLSYFLGLFLLFFIRKEHLLGLLLGGMAYLPVLLPYFEVSKAFSGRALYEGFPFRAEPLSYISSSSVFYREILQFSHPEAQHFVGFVGSFALLLGIYLNLKIVGSLGLFFSLILIYLGGLWASLILPALFVFGNEKRLTLAFLFFLALSFGSDFDEISLHSVASFILPGLDSLRAIGRAGIVVSFIGVVITSKLLPSRVFFVLLPLTIFELSTSKIALEEFKVNNVKPDSEISLILPYSGEVNKDNKISSWGEFAKLNGEAILEFPGKKLVNGYSGLQGSFTEKFAGYFKNFPEPISGRAAKSIVGLKFIYTKESVLAPWLKLEGSVGSFNKYKILDVDFLGKGTLLAPPWQNELTIKWKAKNKCSVSINNQLVSLEDEYIETKLKISSKGVEPTQIPFNGDECDTITIEETR